MSEGRRPLYYTFGNHMHWVDMQWLWGYDVLPGSVRDMLHLCRETGGKGCVNFDGIGYEKMAAECPDALAELRDAVQAGTIEPVGCSYGQPYGLFQGGESNVRQFTYGVRSVRRLLGVRPKTFWEEEFYFFPQLPQILTSCGFTGANLFFQWTWHTPEVPKEAASLILWEGADGTRIPTLPRNTLNVHQWPEDFDGLLEQGLINELDAPAIVQWLELMPSKDWMCRSEVLLPRLKELFADERFELRARTCAEMIGELSESARQRVSETGSDGLPVRKYSMDDVWHGMTLGKNGDRHPRTSHDVERHVLAAEATAALAGLFGRPYASWDVYPTWELDEAWRELLSAQHHDNHECEGLCGFVGYHSMEKAKALASEVSGRTRNVLWNPPDKAANERSIAWNDCGWPRRISEFGRLPYWKRDSELDPGERWFTADVVPPYGYAVTRCETSERTRCRNATVEETDTLIRLSRGRLSVAIDKGTCTIVELRGSTWDRNLTLSHAPLIRFEATIGGERHILTSRRPAKLYHNAFVAFEVAPTGLGNGMSLSLCLHPQLDAVCIDVTDTWMQRPDPGLNDALVAIISPAIDGALLRSDTPFSVSDVSPRHRFRRKYPTGDWMTSSQWFEEVERPFTSHSFVDMLEPGGERGLLLMHHGSQQFLKQDDGIALVMMAEDPWDEGKAQSPMDGFGSFCLMPHDALRDVQRIQAATEYARRYGTFTTGGTPREPGLEAFGALDVTNAPNVLAHALYRESMKSGEHLPDWAGHRMAVESAGACTHPYVIRLVEWNGEPAAVTLKLPGEVALAAKTNLMGECGDWRFGSAPAAAPAHLRDTGWLSIEPATPPEWARGARVRGEEIPWFQVRFTMRPREIATVMADLVMGRKQFRDLDAKREVWAKVHRVEG